MGHSCLFKITQGCHDFIADHKGFDEIIIKYRLNSYIFGNFHQYVGTLTELTAEGIG